MGVAVLPDVVEADDVGVIQRGDDAGLAGEGSLFAIGVVSSAIVGYAAVKYFIQYLAKHSLDVFAWYRLALAAAVVVWIYAVAPA